MNTRIGTDSLLEEKYKCIVKECENLTPDENKSKPCEMDGDSDSVKCLSVIEENKCYNNKCPNGYEEKDGTYCNLKCSLITESTFCTKQTNKCIWIEENEDMGDKTPNIQCLNLV
jgi:hypothetical protein